MANNISLTVSQPCSEKWNNFTPTSTGGFCVSCSKNVIDFTKMSDAEIMSYFKNTSGNTCGRFRKDQLKTYKHQTPTNSRSGIKWLQTGLLSAALVFISRELSMAMPTTMAKTEIFDTDDKKTDLSPKKADGHVVRGIVMSEDKEPLPGVNVVLKGTRTGMVTDIDGKFEFPVELKEGDVLVFSFIGLTTEEYKVGKKSPANIEITMWMEFDIMGEVVIGGAYAQPTGIAGLWHKIKNLF
ncbi:carboxypeptidase-like regulatory domain-containing protein [Fulvivirga sp. 29W222]|uniref:Carboxypeptidase-like regulatory domain-containing protein n=1 Tax=Fulvivirga marina TaxID=2494733 RepID=A0A937G0X4_9BACT|nr:carboxypeptidase-like regulatory domain-containing protein [Fulvivirga marina]MBL6448512.1 carboxypeptidase-like regulatory domain-containing protein [Fulvivirga marina]